MAWDAYRGGTLPIGAVVVATDGTVLASAASGRHLKTSAPGQLANSKIAHAEINALAQLATNDESPGLALYSNVEPCAMCMAAAHHAGVAAVHFAWKDAYTGGTQLTVPNVQAARRWPTVVGPGPEHVRLITACLVACHYLDVRPGHDAVVDAWSIDDPHFLDRVDRGIRQLVASAREQHAPATSVLPELRRAISAE